MRFVLTISFFLAFPLLSVGQRLAYVPGEILIRLSAEEDPQSILSDAIGAFGPMTYTRIMAQPMTVWKVSFDHAGINHLSLLRALKEERHVSVAQNNHIVSDRGSPNDPLYTMQWQYMNDGFIGGFEGVDLEAEAAWDLATGGMSPLGDTIVICVIDDGIDPSHRDFGENLWTNWREIPGNAIDDDGNGYTDDHLGWNIYNGTDDIYSGGGHGTPVAGIVGALGNNSEGVCGVNWNVKLMIVQGGGTEAEVLASYAYPWWFRKTYNKTNGARGAFVVATNASWGTDFGQPEDAPLWCSLYDSLGTAGILNAGATINANVNVDVDGDLPTACTSDYLIAVTNVNWFDHKVTGAGYGEVSIDLGAFGEGTFTTALGNTYGSFGGTSGATPHVTGTIGLVYALPCLSLAKLSRANPGEAALIVKSMILQGTETNASLENITVTGGRLNMGNTLLAMTEHCSSCPFPSNIQITNIDAFSSSVGLDIHDDIDTINMRYKHTDSTAWIVLNDIRNNDIIDALLPCETYEIQIQSVCDTVKNVYLPSHYFTSEGCCENPLGFDFTYDEIFGTSVLSWDHVESAGSYFIEYRPAGTPDWVSLITGSNSLVIDTLAGCTSVEFRMKTTCFYDTTEIQHIGQYSIGCGKCSELDYCNPPPMDASAEWIDRIILGDLDFVSGSDDGYGNYTGLQSVALTQGGSYSLFVIPGFDNQAYREMYRAWIDYDQNGIFEDSELIAESDQPTNSFFFGTVDVPPDALAGYTRMRVAMRFLNHLEPCSAANGETFGEIEDYCVLISRNVIPCDVNISGSVIGVGFDTVHVEVEQNVAAIAYTFRYRKTDEPDWTELSSADETFIIYNLDDCTDYELQFRSVCAFDSTSYSESIGFTTDCLSSVLDQNDPDVRVFPNPFNDYPSIDLKPVLNNVVSLEILSFSGQVLGTYNLPPGHQTSFPLKDFSTWPDGVYFLTIRAGDFRKTVKLLKIR